MSIKIKYRRSALILFSFIATIVGLCRCMDHAKKPATEADAPAFAPAPVFADYTSSEKCVSCHKDIYDNYIHTAHSLTATPATEKYIKGSFRKGQNTYSYTPSILLSMEKRDSGLYQVVYFKGEEKKAMKFDIVIGSGVMGQSYLNWRGNRLYQLPITYFTAASQWSNSPGFPHDRVLIDRPVTSRCLECHATYAEGISGTALEPVEFDRSKIILGVDCQKCHGPATKHVEYQEQHPEDKTAKYIVNPTKLSRIQQLDVCALCHSGNIQKTKPSFQFAAGQALSDYFITDTSGNAVLNGANIDVHGNQYALLRASKCFKMSTTLTCNTCHDTHKNERGQLELLSQRCMGCHDPATAEFKTPTHTSVATLQKNCIDCHMPAQPSKSIAVFLQGQETPKASSLRSHFIAIYPEEAKKFLNK
jgi:nitrate/TMAO reductase-like tetraheme cytochrome c subunit